MTIDLIRLSCAAAFLIAAGSACAQQAPTKQGVEDLEKAKRDAVQADRDWRAAQPKPLPVPKKDPSFGGDTPEQRFERAADGAYIDRTNTRIVDQYRSADGVVIERITYGRKVYCVTSSTVNYVPGILHDASKAREVTCPPPNAAWVRK